MFMPSHREGFGMPVLEAGLVGLPVVCTETPATEEIGGERVTIFDANLDPDQLAEQLLTWADESPIGRLRRQVCNSILGRPSSIGTSSPCLRAAEGRNAVHLRTA